MKYIAFCLLIVLTFFGCKKDDPEGTTGSSSGIRIHEQPPMGYTFPHTYYQYDRTSEFKVWDGNGKDITANHNPDHLVEMDSISVFQIRLRDLNTMEILDSAGMLSDKEYYFFSNDTLFVYTTSYSLPVAKGNYSRFVIANTNGTISGTRTPNSHSTIQFSNIGNSTFASASAFAKQVGFTHIDMIAYFNSSVTLK